MSPKSWLRHKEAISTLFEDLANGHFHNVLDETDDLDTFKVQRIVICSGKVFYDPRAARRERGSDHIAILTPGTVVSLPGGGTAGDTQPPLSEHRGCYLVPGRANEPVVPGMRASITCDE